MSATERNRPVTVGDIQVSPGRRRQVDIPAGRLVTGAELSLPAAVVNGRHAGPHIWLTGVVHGDEVMGAEIVRRVLATLSPSTLSGCVVALPIVNLFGFMQGTRYLPDRRDLNRSFPGSGRGSFAGRLARLVMDEIVAHAEFGIDFHTGSNHRTNLPQIRGDLDDERTLELARHFGTPVIVHSRVRNGSLRHAATALGKRVLVYEAGEANRFDEDAIAMGVAGTRRVMAALGMISAATEASEPVAVRTSSWVRARRSGICVLQTRLGARVAKGDVLGEIRDALGGRPTRVRASHAGTIIGISRDPVVNRGEALVHIGHAP